MKTGTNLWLSRIERYSVVSLLALFWLGARQAAAEIPRYNGPGWKDDSGVAIALDPRTRSVYVTGYSDGGAATKMDIVTIKYDEDGVPSPSWPNVGFGVGVRRWDSPLHFADFGVKVALDAAGNVYVLGNTITDEWGSSDFITLKYSPDGILQWSIPYHFGSDFATSMALDGAGNIVVAGQSLTAGNSDYAVVKYSPNGAQSASWPDIGFGVGVRRYDGSSSDLLVGLAIDSGNNVYVTGSSSVGGKPNYVTLKYSPQGVLRWNKVHDRDSDLQYYAAGIAVDLNYVYVTGHSFAMGVGSDFVTLKYDLNGDLSPTWADIGDGVGVRRYNGWAAGADVPTGIVIDTVSNVWVTGHSMLPNGTRDFTTVRYTANGVSISRTENGTGNGDDVPLARSALSKGLLIAQVAVALVLLVGAGLFLQTVRNLRNVSVGFNPQNVLTFHLSLRAVSLSADRLARINSLSDRIVERVGNLSGVLSIGGSNYPFWQSRFMN